MPIGAALAGVALERLGSTATVGLFSALLVAMAIATALNPHVRRAPSIGRG
jgi:predicted MFS family arabinose efflux permease